MNVLRTFAVGMIFLSSAMTAHAILKFDNTGDWNGTSSIGSMNGGNPGVRAAGQTFFAESDNVLNSFSFFLDGLGGRATGYVMEWDVDRTIGPILFKSAPQVIGPSGLFEYTFNTGNLVLVEGNEYIIFVDAGDVFQDPLAFRIGILSGVEPDSFPGGHLARSNATGFSDNSFASLSAFAWNGANFEGNDAAFTASFSSSGGNSVWARRLGGSEHDGGQGVATDAAGNVYTVGFFRGAADFDPGPGEFNLVPQGAEDAFICKLNRAGNLVWAHQLGGSGRDYAFDIATDASGSVYATGSFEGTVDFDPGPETFNLVSAGSEDVFVCKLNSEGNFVWARRLGGSEHDGGQGVATDSAGNVFTTGHFGSGAFVSKLDTAGNVLWVRQFGGSGNGIAIDDSGCVYTTGNFSGTADFDPGPSSFNLTSQFSFDIFLSKLDSDGNFVWARQIGDSSTSNGRGTGIATDPAGNVYATGVFRGETDFDPGPGSHVLTVEPGDVFVSKFDSGGNFIWVRQFSGDEHEDEPRIALDTSGNIYSAGGFGGTVDFDPGPGVFNMTSDSAVGRETFVTKLDDQGHFVWARQFDATVFDIAVDSFRNIYTTGSFYQTVDFDPGAETFGLSSAGEGDVFVSRLSDDTEPPTIIDVPSSIAQATDPGRNTAMVTWPAPTALDDAGVADLNSTHSAGDEFPLGPTVVIYTAVDDAGNEATAAFTVIVIDEEPPVIESVPANISAGTDLQSTEAVVTWNLPTASDNVGVESFSSTHQSGDSFPIGITDVSYSAVDAAGNQTTATFDVIVSDTESPSITGIPENISIRLTNGVAFTVVMWDSPLAADNVGVIEFASSHNSGETFALGTTTVTYAATDAAGNRTEEGFSVEVVADNDDDGIEDDVDPDDDNDGVPDVGDAFPFDSSESRDTDGDGTGNNADTDDDNDGISDTDEGLLGTDPLLADTDGDGLGDADEVKFRLDPLDEDTDGDGIFDGAEDEDNDTLTNAEEAALGTSPFTDDTDSDGLKDQDEVNLHGTDPTNADTDGDLLEDGVEVNLTGTDPLLADSDGNGTSDAEEDPDRDRYTNLQEVVILLTDPLDSASRFAFEFAHSATDHSLSFTALAARGYRVERSVDVSDPTKWVEVISFVGGGSRVTVPLGSPFSQKWFYRVVVTVD